MANRIPRVPVREQDPKVRATNFEEVCYGYNKEEALLEASRCLNCRNPRCMAACPVGLQIPRFIAELAQGNIAGAAAVIAEDSEEILDLFVRHGVSVNLVYDGCTPLMYAAKTNKKTNTIKWLLKKGASRTDRTTDGKNAADFAAGNTNLPRDGVYKALSKY